MGSEREYDLAMRRLIPASVAGFAVVLLLGLASAQAQVHGTPTSVTSIGFGGHFDRSGIPASVTSVGPRGFGDAAHTFVGFGVQPQRGPRHPQPPSTHHPHRGANAFGQVYAVPYYVPTYVVDQPVAEEAPSVEESNYPAGPTIFDRRASGQSSQEAEAEYADRLPRNAQREPALERESPAAPFAEAPEPQPTTILVYKDGHQQEVQNYAIVGGMLYDLSPGHRNRIALDALDLASTAKQNDDRGIDFQLPVKSDVN